MSLLRKAGCRVFRDERRVYIPVPVVEQAVAQAPREVYLYTRRGEQAMALAAGSLHMRTTSGATGFVDLDSGQRRAPTMDRVIAWAGSRLGKDYLGRDVGQARIPQAYGLDSLDQLLSFAAETESRLRAV